MASMTPTPNLGGALRIERSFGDTGSDMRVRHKYGIAEQHHPAKSETAALLRDSVAVTRFVRATDAAEGRSSVRTAPTCQLSLNH